MPPLLLSSVRQRGKVKSGQRCIEANEDESSNPEMTQTVRLSAEAEVDRSEGHDEIILDGLQVILQSRDSGYGGRQRTRALARNTEHWSFIVMPFSCSLLAF